MKKCRSAEFDVIIDNKNISQETSEIVQKLESKTHCTLKRLLNRVNERGKLVWTVQSVLVTLLLEIEIWNISSQVESMQKIFNNTMNRIEIESI
ncbi:hypothetical protein X798_07646, partial [Onchocerca flexuosa]